MTLLVAIDVPTDQLNPLRQPINFTERCIVIGADSRLTFLDGRCQPLDDAMKLWPISRRTIAGYSGDVELAERAFYSAYIAACSRNCEDSADFMHQAIPAYLNHWGEEIAKCRPPANTIVFVAHHSGPERFTLWKLSSNDNFTPRRRNGINVAGSGADRFKPVLRTEIEHITRSWAAPAKSGYKLEPNENGYPALVPRAENERIGVKPEQVGGLVMSAIDLIVTKAGLPSVGGWSSVMVMRESGVKAIYGYNMSENQRALHHQGLRAYLPRAAPKEFVAPWIDDNGNFPAGHLIKVRFEGGL